MVDNLNHLIELLNRCGEAFWDFASVMAIQVSVLVVILFCIDLLVKRRVRAIVRYWLWALVLVKLVLPLQLGTPASVAHWFPEYGRVVLDNQQGTADTEMNVTTVRHADWMSLPSDPVASKASATADPISVAGAPGVQPGADAGSTIHPNSAIVQLQPIHGKSFVFACWLAVVVILLIVVLRKTQKVRRLVGPASEAPPDLQWLLSHCQGRSGSQGRKIDLKITDRLGSPAICGCWQPTILIPRALLRKLDREQMRLVFAHELAHWKRYDLQMNCCQSFLQMLYFYSPAVWIANAMIRRLREQAVDETVLAEARSEADKYGSTLLDIAALTLRPAESLVRLIGIAESRNALAGRIKRIATRPIPKTAKLGFASLIAVFLLAILLLPMASGRRSVAAPPDSDAAKSTNSDSSPKPATDPQAETQLAPNPPSSQRSALSGRITDETGAPVTDAKIELIYLRNFQSVQGKSDKDGRYSFETVKEPGDYQILITSNRWVGITDRKALPHIDLSNEVLAVRDFVLPRACRLRLQLVNEQGQPVRNVQVYTSLFTDNQNFAEHGTTDKQGGVLLGGLKPSTDQRLVATMGDGYAYSHFTLTLNDPAVIVERAIVLQTGQDVKGTVICSDGKPAAGWHINALPTWWHFGAYPMGQVIGPDGAFTLPHIVDDKYDVTVSIPIGDQLTLPKPLLTAATLPGAEPALALTLDYPSPASMAKISGRVEFTGGSLQTGIHVDARSSDGKYSGATFVRPGQKDFEIGPVPRGTYTIEFQSQEIEVNVIRNVVVPGEPLEVKIAVRGTLSLRGKVVRADSGKPVTQFRAQVDKVQTLSGPNYVQDTHWHEFKSDQGVFSIDLVGPGVYTVSVAAEGLAMFQSGPFDTSKDANRELKIELKEGTSISGTVVDELGQPVDGAKVIAIANASIAAGRLFNPRGGEEAPVETHGGAFTIPQFPMGQGVIKIVHPDYSEALVGYTRPTGNADSEPFKIVLRRGSTVHGHVYDENGQPEPNVTLIFQGREGYSGPVQGGVNQLARVVTDQSGYYEAVHLPELLCHVEREEPWKAWGVVQQVILTSNGKSQTLDLGGTTQLSGRLFVNGNPLNHTTLQVSGDRPSSSFVAKTRTDGDGRFIFRGIPPGQWTLYYATSQQGDAWVRVQDVTASAKDTDLGDVECDVEKLIVHLEPATADATEGLRLELQEYNPIWPFGINVGILAPREKPQGPFVFEQVPPGKYELICSRPDQFINRRLVEVTKDQQQELTLKLSPGTASLSGKLDKAICENFRALKVWSKDQRLLGRIVPKEDESYRLDNIPAGEYFIKQHDTRTGDTILTVSLGEGEQKTLDIVPEVVTVSNKPAGVLWLRIFNPEGLPIPGCEIRFEGTQNPPTLHSSQDASLVFVGTPGTYDATISFSGFKPLHQTLELKSTAAPFSEVHLYLQPSEE